MFDRARGGVASNVSGQRPDAARTTSPIDSIGSGERQSKVGLESALLDQPSSSLSRTKSTLPKDPLLARIAAEWGDTARVDIAYS